MPLGDCAESLTGRATTALRQATWAYRSSSYETRTARNAVVYVDRQASEPKGGKVVYAWFGLLNSPVADRLVYDLFPLAAGHVTDGH